MFNKAHIEQSTRGLRKALFEEIEALQSGKSNAQRAVAVTKAADKILASVRMDMDYHRFVKQQKLDGKDTLSYLMIGK